MKNCRLTIYFPDGLMDKVRKDAAEEMRTISSYIVEAVRYRCERHAAEWRPFTRNNPRLERNGYELEAVSDSAQQDSSTT